MLRQIDDVDDPLRGARFVAAVALVTPDGREFTTRGEMGGQLARVPRGANGFGYDPIFVADDQLLEPGTEPLTTAQMTAEQKDAISHRGRALRAMVPQLLEVLGLETS